MEPSIYVGVSGQLALQRRLDTIAHNVANSGTSGFRAENVTFETLLSRSATAYASRGSATFSQRTGPMTRTDNPLDVAVAGDAYLAIGTPGGTAYTRDGRMQVSPAGTLETLEGHAVLDAGGAPIQVNAALGPIEIARNGSVSIAGERVAQIGLFTLPADARLARAQNSGLVPDRPAEAVADFSASGLVQGFVEGANVNPLSEMTRLITLSRAFESLSATLDQSDRRLSDAIRTLGSGSGR
jgi:flagellar basal-body rod protein FlgF